MLGTFNTDIATKGLYIKHTQPPTTNIGLYDESMPIMSGVGDIDWGRVGDSVLSGGNEEMEKDNKVGEWIEDNWQNVACLLNPKCRDALNQQQQQQKKEDSIPAWTIVSAASFFFIMLLLIIVLALKK